MITNTNLNDKPGKKFSQHMPITPALERQKQEDHCKVGASLRYRVRPGPVIAKQQDPAPKEEHQNGVK